MFTEDINLGLAKRQFSLDYDQLVIAVGAYSRTFGIPGVKEHACFLKEVSDARKIRKRVIDCKFKLCLVNRPRVTEIQP